MPRFEEGRQGIAEKTAGMKFVGSWRSLLMSMLIRRIKRDVLAFEWRCAQKKYERAIPGARLLNRGGSVPIDDRRDCYPTVGPPSARY
jgi:hypothetical protein